MEKYSWHWTPGPNNGTSAYSDTIILNDYPLVPIMGTPESSVCLFNIINISLHKTLCNMGIGLSWKMHIKGMCPWDCRGAVTRWSNISSDRDFASHTSLHEMCVSSCRQQGKTEMTVLSWTSRIMKKGGGGVMLVRSGGTFKTTDPGRIWFCGQSSLNKSPH